MTKKKSGLKRSTLTLGAVGVLGLSYWASQTFYKVSKVVDGDTFQISTGQYVRFDSVNAPEIDYCLGGESKKELEKLILNKKVFIKLTYIDGFNRIIGSVYTREGNVGAKILEKGLATFEDKGLQNQRDLLKISQKAREMKVGVYSEKCTQKVNIENPKCDVKGNIYNGEKIYHQKIVDNIIIL